MLVDAGSRDVSSALGEAVIPDDIWRRMVPTMAVVMPNSDVRVARAGRSGKTGVVSTAIAGAATAAGTAVVVGSTAVAIAWSRSRVRQIGPH